MAEKIAIVYVGYAKFDGRLVVIWTKTSILKDPASQKIWSDKQKEN